ncbi:hypothetical protein QAD02_018621 [Eretmocerus hayati]|uniref:Uncharacterized protein n=1 Tax=Eretmocerus hayati TaxID=131215 RepID=A0ACC2PHQ7_9HYME|nr:hypothetical protein QAD02_018621 [Eretmocerus hayati]
MCHRFDRIKTLIVEPIIDYAYDIWGKWLLRWFADRDKGADQLNQHSNLNNTQVISDSSKSKVDVIQDDSAIKKQPVNELKKDKKITHELNEFHKSNVETSNCAKNLNKRLMQDGVEQRIELLDTIKSLWNRTRRVEKLEKELHDINEIKDATTQQQTTRSTSHVNLESANSQSSEKVKKAPVVRQSTLETYDGKEIGRSNVEKQVSVTDPLHLSTISEIPSDNYSGKSTIEKLEQISATIDEMQEKVQFDIANLAHRLLGMFDGWEEAKATREHHRQLAHDLSYIHNMLLAELEKVKNLQRMVNENSSTEKEKIDTGSTSINRQQITSLEQNLQKLEEVMNR